MKKPDQETTTMQAAVLPEVGFVRLTQIVGDRKRGITPILPVGKSTWWAGVRSGRFPKPVKLGPRTTVWKVEDIQRLIDEAVN